MKKSGSFILAFMLLFGLTACRGDTGDTPVISDTESLYIQEVQDTPTAAAEKNEDDAESVLPERTGEYIGNKNSKKFHYPSCHTLPSEKNRVYFNTRDEAIQYGYNPCGNCNP